MIQIVVLSLMAMASGQPIVGGLTKQNPSEYTDLAWESVTQINNQSNDVDYLVPIKVLNAQTQVVAGTNTEMEVLVGESTCQRNGSVQLTQINEANCPVKLGGGRAIYKVSILSQPWLNVESVSVKKIRDVDPSENL